jgi:single-stranded DNA-specific DHH superfamily exonuclease
MPTITQTQAKEFLDNISEKDKVAVIHHDDSDGFASGILFYDWCKSKKAKTEQFTYSIRTTKLKNLDLEKFNKVIVCDLASDFMAEELELIKEKEIFYTDHHPKERQLPEKTLELITTAQGYIPSSRTAGELTNLKPWLALCGTISDCGHYYPENQDFIDTNLKKLDMTLENFQQNITSVITNLLIYFNKDYDQAFKILQKIKSIKDISELKKYSEPIENEVQKFVTQYKEKKESLGNIDFYYFEPKFSVKGPVCGIISGKDLDRTYIFASPKNKTNKITLSARNTHKRINTVELLKAGINGLEESNAGGHPQAAGGIILAKDLGKFKQNIRNYVNQN